MTHLNCYTAIDDLLAMIGHVFPNAAHIPFLNSKEKFTHSFCRQEVITGSEAIQIPPHVLSCWLPALGIGCSDEQTLHNLSPLSGDWMWQASQLIKDRKHMQSLRHVVCTRRCVARPCPLGTPLCCKMFTVSLCAAYEGQTSSILSPEQNSLLALMQCLPLVFVRCDDSRLDGHEARVWKDHPAFLSV